MPLGKGRPQVHERRGRNGFLINRDGVTILESAQEAASVDGGMTDDGLSTPDIDPLDVDSVADDSWISSDETQDDGCLNPGDPRTSHS